MFNHDHRGKSEFPRSSRSSRNKRRRYPRRPTRAFASTNAPTFVKHNHYERSGRDPIRSRRGFLKAKLRSNLISSR